MALNKNTVLKVVLYFTYLAFIIGTTIKLNQNINQIIDGCRQNPVDYQLIPIEQCYLTVHNFIRFESMALFNNQSEISFKNNQSLKTYIYSYTKPYLIELIQNNSKDCLCYE